MNVEQIRRELSRTNPGPKPATIADMCRKALFQRPPTVRDHAEILYFYAEANAGLSPTSAAENATFARHASAMAEQEGDFLLAVKARCLYIGLLSYTTVQLETCLDYLNALTTRLRTIWVRSMSSIDQQSALMQVNSLANSLSRLKA